MTSRWRQVTAFASALHLWAQATTAAEERLEQAPLGAFLDHDGRVREPSHGYLRHLEGRRPGHLLTIAEELSFLGAGTVWYWLDKNRNVADWDFPSWEQRFTLEAWRYDNNHFPINFLGHALNGAAFYGLPRANGHGVGVSAAYAFGTSFAWEFLLEFREKVSVNDLVVTQGAGMVIGEFAAKLWHYASGLPPGASGRQRAVAATIGLPVWVKRRAYGESEVVPGPYDERGLATAIGKRLAVGYELRRHEWDDRSATLQGVTLGGRLSTLPGEGRPGRFDFFFHEADVARLSLFAGAGPRGREVDLLSDLLLLGLHTQSLDLSGDGAAATFGLAMGYRYRFRVLDGHNDRLGIVHLPGPGIDATFRAGPAEVSLTGRVSGDFAGINALAYGQWADANLRPGDRPKSILRKHGYAYGWGASARLGAELSLPPLDARATTALGSYRSHEGLDRVQEEVTHDPSGRERVFELDASVGVALPLLPLRLGVGHARSERASELGPFARERALRTWSATLALTP